MNSSLHCPKSKELVQEKGDSHGIGNYGLVKFARRNSDETRMRVLIRENRTSRFLARKEQWVPVRTQALDFAGSIFAVEAAERMGLKGVEIVLDFGNRDVVLPNPGDSELSSHAA